MFTPTLVAAFSTFFLVGEDSLSPLRLATWNLENLRDENGEQPTPRIDGDYALLQLQAMELDADVVALQEVENVAAAHRVFDPDEYVIELSKRREGSDGQIRTGFAIRHGVPYSRYPDVRELDIAGRDDLRWGVEIEIEHDGAPLRLLSVHLKSYCFSPTSFREGAHCDTRLAQTAPLEAWIDARAAEGVAFAVLGDFNRRYDDPDDQEWEELDDGEPAGADLFRPNEGVGAQCDPRYSQFIDHIILGENAASKFVAGSFQEVTFDIVRADGKLPSDHCPLMIELR